MTSTLRMLPLFCACLCFACQGELSNESRGQNSPRQTTSVAPTSAATNTSNSSSSSTSPGNTATSANTSTTSATNTTASAPPDVDTQPLLRLSSRQYNHVVEDLLSREAWDQVRGEIIFPKTEVKHGFTVSAQANIVNTSESNRIEDNAERMATALLSQADAIIPTMSDCVPTGFTQEQLHQCIDTFIDDFFPRAYRRPLTTEERRVVRALYDAVGPEQGAKVGWAALMQLAFQAPALLYRTEQGTGALAQNVQLKELNSWERATRLSFFLTDSLPDAILFEAAKNGELATKAQVQAQAVRLLETPRGKAMLSNFHQEWLEIQDLAKLAKSDPAYSSELGEQMLAQVDDFVTDVLENQGGSLDALMMSDKIPVAQELESFYGVSTEGRVTQSIPNRRGILSLAGVMAVHSKEASTDPIERGIFIYENMLCEFAPTFPGNLDTEGPLEESAGEATARQRLQPLMERAQCSGCHITFNPLGLAMENYDALGRWRQMENGEQIDPSGTFSAGGLSSSFVDVNQFVDQLAKSERMGRCYTKQWFRFALGRRDGIHDRDSVKELGDAFLDSGREIKALVVAMTLSDAFLYKRMESAQ